MIRTLHLACDPPTHVYMIRDGLRALVTSLHNSELAEDYAQKLRGHLDADDLVLVTGDILETHAQIIDQKSGWALFLPDDSSFGENFRLPE
ncbi:MAG TPA: hypothetical protein VM661_14760 [Candidatus Sulfotelmatobacter sp.]|jgi:hypothetical protein|nr:hypothetical protein [Candidatus Sulfotelmatobacter sp.]